MPVLENRESHAGRHAWVQVCAVVTFPYSPAVVPSQVDDVSFFPGTLTNVSTIEFPRTSIERKPPWIPHAHSVDFLCGGGRGGEGVGRRNSIWYGSIGVIYV